MNERPGPESPIASWQFLPQAESVVDREIRNPFLRYVLHVGLPVSISLVVHVAVVAFLAMKVFPLPSRGQFDIGPWEGTVVQAEELSGAFQWAGERPLDIPDGGDFDASLDDLASLTDARSLDLSELAKPPGSGAGREPGEGLDLGDGPLSLLGTGGGAGPAGSGGFGAGLGDGGLRIGQAGIWDLTVPANRIVYVVDFSGSIIVAVDDLKRELKRSVGRLTPAQSFNVILFYSTGGGQDEQIKTESFKPKLEPANQATRREFFQWIDRKAPMGMTRPLQAIKRAIELDPEVIFFFSDGYFDDAIVAEIKRANSRGRSRIFCVVFDDQLLGDASALTPRETEGSRRLRRIAEANGGTVKIVTAKDLAR